MATIEINSENFEKEVLNSEIPVLVDFWAPWCRPCLMMAPILEELSEDLEGKVKIGKINTETSENQILAIQFRIQSIPNMKLFYNGKVIQEFVGLRPKEVLLEELTQELDLDL
jgi:thioredoxin 1